MTVELEKVINTLSNNITVLKEEYQKVLNENSELKDELLSLKNQIITKENENNDLITNYESLKMAKTIAVSSGDAHDAKIKINKLVREIDKCISLLNK